jgi:hypothetical protein
MRGFSGPQVTREDTPDTTLEGRRLVARRRPVPRLTVGAVDDPAEREADRHAAAVVAAIRAGNGSMAAFTGSATRIRRSSGRPAAIRPGNEHGGPVGAAGGSLDADTASRIQAARSGGVPLAVGERRTFESAFGVGLDAVRLHAGPGPSELNKRLGATAFTLGSDVFFRDRLPGTSTAGDQHLMAHELAHVVQQGGEQAHRHPDMTIRRKIGLEFETGVPVRNEADEKLDYQTLVFVAKNGMWKIVADSSHMEFVTEPFDEDKAGGGALVKSVKQMVQWLTRATAVANASATGFAFVSDVAPGLGDHYLHVDAAGQTSNIRFGMPKGTSINMITAAPQASGGIPLERIPALVHALGTVELQHLEGTVGSSGKPRRGAAIGLSGMAPTTATMLSRGALAAHKYADARHPGAPRGRTDRLRGLLTLVYSYLFAGAEQRTVWEYSKIIAPLMARTDFTTMHSLLTDEEKADFDPVEVLRTAGLTTQGPVFAKGYGEPGDIAHGPRRIAWLRSIVNGPVDLLSMDGGSSVTEGRSGSSASMGAMHQADEAVAGGPLVVLELRRLPKRQPASLWVNTAQVLFELFTELSNPGRVSRPRRQRRRAGASTTGGGSSA